MEPSLPNIGVDIQLKSAQSDNFIKFLDTNDLVYTIMIDDLEKLIQQEETESKGFAYSGKFDYLKYNQYSNVPITNYYYYYY